VKILQKISVVEWIDMPINLQELIEPWKFEGSFGIHNNSYLQWTIEEKKKHNLYFDINNNFWKIYQPKPWKVLKNTINQKEYLEIILQKVDKC